MAIKAIVFDLWNTLAYNKGKNPIVELKNKLNINIRDLERGFMTKQFDNAEQAMTNLCNYLKMEPDKRTIKKLLDIWNDPIIEANLFDDVLPVLKELKKDYKLGLISNVQSFGEGFFQDVGFPDLFDVTIFSSDIGILKPDPRIFELMIKKLGVKPEEALMVGDILNDDVIAAQNIGMDAVLIKRVGDYALSWKEKRAYKKTIKDLYELRDYLKKNG